MPPLSSPGGVATLSEVGDVDLTGLADGDGIQFDQATLTWLAGLPDGEFYQLGGNAAAGPAGSYPVGTVTNNPEGVSGATRTDIWWDNSGLRVYTIRPASPRLDQYDVFPAFSVNPGPPSDWTNMKTITTPVGGGMQLSPDGTVLGLSVGGANGFLLTHDISTAFDITTTNPVASGSILFAGTGAQRFRWTADGLTVFVELLGGLNIIRKITLATPFSLAAPITVFDFDYFTDAASINGWTISDDGIFLYASRNSDKRLVSWEFAVPFDMSSSNIFDGTNGPLLNAGLNFFVPEGFFFRTDNGDLIMGDSLKSGSANQRMQVLSL